MRRSLPGQMSVHEFIGRKEELDRRVLDTPGISPVCSGADWILAASDALLVPESFLFVERHGSWLAFGKSRLLSGRGLIHPLESTWGFACPLIGASAPDSAELLRELAASCEDLEAVLLSGIPAGSPLERSLETLFSDRLQWRTPPLISMVADIGQGIDAYVNARKTSLRQTIRASERRVKAARINIELAHASCSSEEILNRVLRVESGGWKARKGGSIFQQSSYLDFYDSLIRRTAASGSLRALFATRDGADVAYVFGSILGHTYRGYQMSYREEVSTLGLGHVLQLEMMRLTAEGGVRDYDFGMWAEYKEAWADRKVILRSAMLYP